MAKMSDTGCRVIMTYRPDIICLRPRSVSKEGSQDYSTLTLRRLRQGFAETHLSHLFIVSQATVSRIVISWIIFMYRRFGVINIWPSREEVSTKQILKISGKHIPALGYT